MTRIIIAALAGVIAGIVLTNIAARDAAGEQFARVFGTPVLDAHTDCPAANIEETLRLEQDTSQRLLHEIVRLEKEIERLSQEQSGAGSLGGQDWIRGVWAELESGEPTVDRRQLLIDGGFAPQRADWLLQRESELQMAAVEEGDSALGLPQDLLQVRVQMRGALRAEIGDYEYERYLVATGQSTAVAVTQVLPDSPAEIGGLQVGDEIVDYDGKRLFNVFELSDASRADVPGSMVVVNIERGGAPMQLVLPRGALGISAGIPMR